MKIGFNFLLLGPLLLLRGVAFGQPVITTQPKDQTNYVGTTAIFTVEVTGTAPVTYQWQRFTTNFGGLAGETNSMLSFVNVQTNDAADYRVVVTDATGTTNSVAAHLYVLPLPELFISQSVPGSVTLTWSATNWVLVQSGSMSCAAWLRVPGNSPVTLSIRPGTMPFYSDTMFFRLAALPLVGPSQSELDGCRVGCVTCCENYVAAYLLNPGEGGIGEAVECASIGVALGSCISAAQLEWLDVLNMQWYGP